jgi:predicted kinase
VVLLAGPRQSGKTTLARAAFPDKAYVTLEPLDTAISRARTREGSSRNTAMVRSSTKCSTRLTC